MKALSFGLLAGLTVLAAGLGVSATQRHVESVKPAVRDVDMLPALGGPHGPTVADHIVDLPEDGQAWYATIVTTPAWKSQQRERQLVAWFGSNPALVSLRVQTHFNHYTTNDALFRARLSRAVSATPAVILQDASGKVVYKATGTNVPATDAELAVGIQKAITDCCPFRPRPPKPTPPDVTPPPDDKPVIPDVGPVTPDAPPADYTFALATIAAVVAGLVAAFVQFKQRVAGSM